DVIGQIQHAELAVAETTTFGNNAGEGGNRIGAAPDAKGNLFSVQQIQLADFRLNARVGQGLKFVQRVKLGLVRDILEQADGRELGIDQAKPGLILQRDTG